MKNEEKQKSIELRKQGLSIKSIAKLLHVSKTAVSTWVKDIVLSPEQIKALNDKSKYYRNGLLGANSMKNKAKEKRLKYQNSGRILAKNRNWLHVAGCMLYWGEGAKNRNCCQLVNSDPDMLIFFLKFLYECYNIPKEKVRVTVHAHTTINSIDKIEKYWSDKLNLPNTCFTKSVINKTSASSKNKRVNSLPFGTVRLNVNSTELVQNIFGAIQEYSGSNNKFID